MKPIPPKMRLMCQTSIFPLMFSAARATDITKPHLWLFPTFHWFLDVLMGLIFYFHIDPMDVWIEKLLESGTSPFRILWGKLFPLSLVTDQKLQSIHYNVGDIKKQFKTTSSIQAYTPLGLIFIFNMKGVRKRASQEVYMSRSSDHPLLSDK